MEKVEAYYSHRLGLWIVRLQEIVEDPTKEGAERKAKHLLGLYHGVASFDSSYTEKLGGKAWRFGKKVLWMWKRIVLVYLFPA